MPLNVISTINLDMAHPNVNVINAVQYDSSGRVVKAHLYNNGISWKVPTGVFPVIRYQKSDRIGGYYDTDENGIYAISYEDSRGTINLTLALQVLTTPGNVNVQVNFYNSSGVRVTSFAFRLSVQRSVVPDGQIVSSEYYNALTELVSEAVDIATLPDSIRRAETAAIRAEDAAERAEEAADSEISSRIPPMVTAWLNDNITNPSSPPLDRSLSVASAATPADLSGSIKRSVQQVGDSVENIDRVNVMLWYEQGSINSSGQDIDSATRIRTPFIPITRYVDTTIYCDSGYLYELHKYNSSKTEIEVISWNNTSRHIDPTTCAYIRLLVCKSNSANIVPNEGEHVKLYGYTPLYAWKARVESEFIKNGGYVTSGSLSVLSDANNAALNSYYTIRFTENETNILPHLPFDRTKNGKTDFLYLLCFGSSAYKYQILYDRVGDIWTRLGVVSNNYWFSWYKNSSDTETLTGETIHVGAGQEYTKLTDAIKYAFEHANTTVIVHPGTYNIITEMGSAYWENFSGYSDLTHSKIGNGAHFIFSPDSLVTCEYTGSNSNVRTYYSPFNSLDGYEGSFTLEGLTLITSGCRYAIHDDVGASTIEQTHKYINCDISDGNRCIGGGLGAYMTVEMKDCVFRSTGQVGNSPVSWHNSGGGTTGKCSIIMTGCYVDGAGDNSIQFLAYGISTKKTRVMVSNNSFNTEPICKKFDETIPNMNIEMFAFNNEIRQV